MTDKELRPLILAQLAQDHPGAVAVKELPLRREKRADIVVIENAIWGYEIKSDHDKLDRLPLQVPFYDSICDYSHLIAAERHVEKAKGIVPTRWGIWSVSSDGTITVVRQARRNRQIDIQSLAMLLWKQEAIRILRQFGDATPSASCVTKLWAAMESAPSDEVRSSIRQTLRARMLIQGHAQL